MFCRELAASDAARLTCVSVRLVNNAFLKLRARLACECERRRPFKGGDVEVEVDESYFGPRRVRGRQGRGAARKTIVFGIFNRDRRVYSEVVPGYSKSTLSAVIRGRITAAVVIHYGDWPGYDALVIVGYKKHFRVRHGKGWFVNGKSHINGIESFWGYADRRLVKFDGVS
jgi:transposase